MNVNDAARNLLLIVCATTPPARSCLGAEGDFITETGGVTIALFNGWKRLDQPVNFFVQKRARNADQGIALSAGSFTLDLTLEQYAALGLAGLQLGPDGALERLAERVAISTEEVEKALASKIGRQMMDSLKQTSRTMKFELLKVNRRKAGGMTTFDIHSKMTVAETGQTIFSRQFLLPGSSRRQIVQITFAGTSERVLSRRDLADAIRPKGKAK